MTPKRPRKKPTETDRYCMCGLRLPHPVAGAVSVAHGFVITEHTGQLDKSGAAVIRFLPKEPVYERTEAQERERIVVTIKELDRRVTDLTEEFHQLTRGGVKLVAADEDGDDE